MTEISKPRRFVSVVVVGILAGLVGALVTVAFIGVLNGLTDVVWDLVPRRLGVDADAAGYLAAVPLIGAVLVGVCRRFFGDYPKELQEDLKEFRRTQRFDYGHLPQIAATSFAALVFGAALGPEAALVGLAGGLATWAGDRIHARALSSETISYVGIAGALGALFGSPIGSSALPLETTRKDELPRWWTIIPGICSAAVGLVIFRLFFSGGYLEYDFPSYTFSAGDLVPVLPVAAVGAALGMVFLAVLTQVGRLVAVFDRHGASNWWESKALVGGIALAVLAVTISPLVLFSGHEGIQTLIDDNASNTTAFLLTVGLAKAAAAACILATGWKGGRFFPLMFVGVAIGIAATHVFTGIPLMVGLAAGIGAPLAAVVQKPLAITLIMLFILPLDLWPTAAVACVIASGIGYLLVRFDAGRVVFGPHPSDTAAQVSESAAAS